MNVLVIGGGISSEREVSLRSAHSILKSLKKNRKHHVSMYDWDGSEKWLNDNLATFDVVFPALHGEGGEDGQIQKILENNHVAYIGTDSHNSANCIDKIKTKSILRKNGIRVPDGSTVNLNEYKKHHLYNHPHVLKPLIGGSSIDTFIFPEISNRIDSEIVQAFNTHHILLIEEFISGVEITVPILGFKSLPIIEIIPPKNATFDYKNKYNGKTQELCPAVHVSDRLQSEAGDIAEKVHKIMGCRHLSRTDMIIQNNEIIVLEINTMPGFTEQSLYPRSARVSGLDMIELTERLINLACEADHGK